MRGIKTPLSLSLLRTDIQDGDTDTTHCASEVCVILVETEAFAKSEFLLNQLSMRQLHRQLVMITLYVMDYKVLQIWFIKKMAKKKWRFMVWLN